MEMIRTTNIYMNVNTRYFLEHFYTENKIRISYDHVAATWITELEIIHTPVMNMIIILIITYIDLI